MSHGRHSRPRARGGGLAAFLALALAGGAVAVALRAPSTTLLRLCVVGGAAVGAVGLLLLARLQRVSSRRWPVPRIGCVRSSCAAGTTATTCTGA